VASKLVSEEKASNENKMSDGWRESASLWVEGDVS
jgi:hypothetical protein